MDVVDEKYSTLGENWYVNTGMKETHSDLMLKHIEKCWQITVFTQMRQGKSFIDTMRISVTCVGNLTWSLYCKDICSQQIEVENVSLSCCEHQNCLTLDEGWIVDAALKESHKAQSLF